MSPCVISGRTNFHWQAIFHLKENFSRSVNRARRSTPWGNTLLIRGKRGCCLAGEGICWGAHKLRLFSQGSEKAASVPYAICFRSSIFFSTGTICDKKKITTKLPRNNVVLFWFIFHEKTGTIGVANFHFKRVAGRRKVSPWNFPAACPTT